MSDKKQWRIKARKTVEVYAYVEAIDEADAIAKFNEGDWIDETESECVDIERIGSPREASE